MLSTESSSSPVTVDCRGMQCPAPILRLAETARKHKDAPTTITILATDEDFPMDLEAWCRSSKATIVDVTRSDGEIRATVALAGAPAPARAASKPSPRTPPVPAPTTAPTTAPTPTPTQQSAHQTVHDMVAATSPTERVVIDGCGLSSAQVMKRLAEVTTLSGATSLRVIADAAGIDARLLSWASANDAEIESMRKDNGRVMMDLAIPVEFEAPSPVAKRAPAPSAVVTTPAQPEPTPSESSALATVPDDGAAVRENRATLLVLKNDLEGLLAAMMSANAAAAQGMKVEVFFSFWAVHLLRGEKPRANMASEPVGFIGRMMKWMVPAGPERQQLARLRMGGLGTRMLNWLMRRRNILTLDKLIEQAVQQDVRFVVCSMSMGLMGLTKRDIVDLPNVDFAGVASFVERSRRSSFSLVF